MRALCRDRRGLSTGPSGFPQHPVAAGYPSSCVPAGPVHAHVDSEIPIRAIDADELAEEVWNGVPKRLERYHVRYQGHWKDPLSGWCKRFKS